METKLNEQIERNVGLNARLNETIVQTILNNVVKDLQFLRKTNWQILQKVLSLKVKKHTVKN